MSSTIRALAALTLCLACDAAPTPSAPVAGKAATKAATPDAPEATKAAIHPPAIAKVAAADPCAAAKREGGSLRWFHDDYPGALACARSKSVPLMIDMWAPWCHTCLSMQAYVLTDERLADYDRRYVFLALDTDREANAEIVAKFPPAAWPTFFAVSSADETIATRLVGAATVEQFAQFLDDGERGSTTDDSKLGPHERAARAGDRAAAGKEWTAAAASWAEALAAAPAGWARTPDVHVSRLAALVRAEAWADCAATVRDAIEKTGRSASAADFSAHALNCAASQPDAAVAKSLREAVIARLGALVDDTAAPLSADDRSDAMMILRQALDAVGRKDDARRTATKQRAVLDAAAADATDPRIAMTYNWPRAEVYAYLGVHRELVPALEQSIAALPKEYDPPYRLAWLLWQAGDLDAAVPKAEQAIGLAYGARKAKAQAMLADIHAARRDVDAERKARTEVVATLRGLPAAAQNEGAIAKAEADLAKVGAAPEPAAK